jgi:hypothetical protein
MSVAPESGRNRIMIYGPKNDGTYVVKFKTADGEALAISVPRKRRGSSYLPLYAGVTPPRATC